MERIGIVSSEKLIASDKNLITMADGEQQEIQVPEGNEINQQIIYLKCLVYCYNNLEIFFLPHGLDFVLQNASKIVN